MQNRNEVKEIMPMAAVNWLEYLTKGASLNPLCGLWIH